MFTAKLTTLLALAAAAVALPAASDAPTASTGTNALSLKMQAAFDCNNPVQGLSRDDCNWLRDIGFAGYGWNPTGNSPIWLGDNGPNVFTFTNKANADVTLILWDQSLGYASSFVSANPPMFTYSLPRGAQVKLSLQNGISGAYSAVYRGQTRISQWGQTGNTWGEFTTGQDATINISREINMSGNTFVAKVSTGCVSDMNRCSFHCKWGANTCGEKDTYDLVNCAPGSQPGASYGLEPYFNQPSGGCKGWDNGSGRIDAEFW